MIDVDYFCVGTLLNYEPLNYLNMSLKSNVSLISWKMKGDQG